VLITTVPRTAPVQLYDELVAMVSKTFHITVVLEYRRPERDTDCFISSYFQGYKYVELYLYVLNMFHKTKFYFVVLGDVTVIVLVFGPKVRRFKPGRRQWISKGDKIRSTPSFGEKEMPSAPCREILWYVKRTVTA
jgi:hypothetical protein